MAMSSGRIIGIVGGILVLVGMFLPWLTATNSITGESASLMGAMFPIFGWLALIFGVLGLIFVAIGSRGMCIAGLIMGILAFIMVLLGFALSATLVSLLSGGIVAVGYGIYISMIGSIILIVGAGLGMGQAKKAAAPPVAPMAPPPM
jgi:hypothetical protein